MLPKGEANVSNALQLFGIVGFAALLGLGCFYAFVIYTIGMLYQ